MTILINPDWVTQYSECKGGWCEEELNHSEQGLTKVPQQPVNTYTNIAYLAGGLFIVFQLNTLPAIVFFITSLYLCVGSSLYHSTSTRWGGSIDVSAMYGLFSGLTFYYLSALIGLEDTLTALIMFVVAIIMGYLLRFKYKGNVHLKIGIFILLTYGFLVWTYLINNISLIDGYLIVSFAVFLIAYLSWIMDFRRVFPIKRWGHGLFHILSAIAISMLFYTIYLIK